MNTTTIIGIVAGICTTAAIVPQIWRTWKTKKANDVSMSMFIVLLTGVALWTVYGIIKEDVPIILANGISFLLNILMLKFILTYDKNSNDSDN